MQATLQRRRETYRRMLPQSAALEDATADKLRVSTKRGASADLIRTCVATFPRGAGPKGSRHQARKGQEFEMVFVLDKRGKPLMPCTEKRARLMLERRRARVHRMVPFTIRLVDRT